MDSGESNDRLLELAGEQEGVAVFDLNQRLISFSGVFRELYNNNINNNSSNSGVSDLETGMLWSEILARNGCKVPISIVPQDAKNKLPQELLLNQNQWIRVHSWLVEDGTVVTVHSDISEIKKKIRDRRLRFQKSRAGGFGSFPCSRARVDECRRASTGTCQTIHESASESGDDAASTGSSSSKLSRSLPVHLGLRVYVTGGSSCDKSDAQLSMASLAATPTMTSANPTDSMMNPLAYWTPTQA